MKAEPLGVIVTFERYSYSDRKPPTFDLVSIGVLQYHPTTILSDVWIDDVRMSKQPIGCGD